MKYIIGVLCVTYLPAYAFAEQLQDNTNVRFQVFGHD